MLYLNTYDNHEDVFMNLEEGNCLNCVTLNLNKGWNFIGFPSKIILKCFYKCF